MATRSRSSTDAATCILALDRRQRAAASRGSARCMRHAARDHRASRVIGAMFALAAVLFVMRPLLPAVRRHVDRRRASRSASLIGVALSAQSPAVVMALLAETRAEGPLSQRHARVGRRRRSRRRSLVLLDRRRARRRRRSAAASTSSRPRSRSAGSCSARSAFGLVIGIADRRVPPLGEAAAPRCSRS